MHAGNKSLAMLKMFNFDRKFFTFSHVAYITVDFNKFVRDLFHPGSALVENE